MNEAAVKLGFCALLPVLGSVLLYLLDRKSPVRKVPYMARQVLYGLVFGAPTGIIAGAMGGVLQGAALLGPLHSRIGLLSGKLGRFPTMLLLSVVVCAVFCNQTIGIIMLGQLSGALYGAGEKKVWMSDMEDSVVTIAGLVPWCIASAVPRAMLGASAASIPLSAFLWLLPLCTLLREKAKKHSA